MKNVLLAIALTFSMNVFAQTGSEISNVFIRVYDLDGRKIAKGKIYSIPGSSIELTRKNEVQEIPLNRIGSIRTKHSAGNNVLIGAAIGGSVMAVAGAASADPDAWILAYSTGEGAAAGAILGGAAGAAIGGITVLFKRSKKYEINGDKEKLETFKKVVSR